MPFVDLNSKKIYGCKKNSRTYFHEQGHIVFDNSEFGTRVKYYHYYFIMIAVVFIPFNFFINSIFLKVFTLLNGFGVLTTYLIEELWCEWFALKKIWHK